MVDIFKIFYQSISIQWGKWAIFFPRKAIFYFGFMQSAFLILIAWRSVSHRGKNSQFQSLIFHKIHISKTLLFDKIHNFKISFLDKIHKFKITFLTKSTFSKISSFTKFTFSNLIFHKIHIFHAPNSKAYLNENLHSPKN